MPNRPKKDGGKEIQASLRRCSYHDTKEVIRMEERKPAYYAIIPADVRYDDRIPANAKLLYGEISALIGADGFCYASNQYFARIYGMSADSISRLFKKLEDNGYNIMYDCSIIQIPPAPPEKRKHIRKDVLSFF